MTVPGNLSSPLLATAGDSAAAAFQIDRSLRFNSDDDTYLFRDPSSHGNRKVFTFSFWVKRAKLGTVQLVLYIRSGPGNTGRVRFDSSDRLEVESEISGSAVAKKVTSAKFRDCSAWQHFVVKFDAVNTNCDIYHNGVELTDFDTNTEPTNVDHYFGGDFQHYIGGYADSSNVDGYLAEVHYIDGSALDESSFGQFDSNSVWQPKQYSGTYGTNGFYLNFSDNSSNAALGTDSSGNDNTWTVYNLTAEGIDANTSQTWSSSQTGYHNSGAASAFDGDFSTSGFAGGGASANAYVDFSAINASKVEVYVSAYGSGSAGGYWYARQTNGTQHTYTITSSGTSLGWVTVYDGSQIQINRLGGARDSDGDAGSAQRAWRVDGKILVNSGTSGVGLQSTDSLIDTPTNYTADSGNNGGNYAVMNPLSSATTLSNGNLDSTGASGYNQCLSSVGMSSGKYYCEITLVDDDGYTGVGIGLKGEPGTFLGNTDSGYLYYSYNGRKRTLGTNTNYGDSFTTGDVVGIAFDADAGNLYFYKNGTIQNSGTAAFTGLTSGPYFFAVDQYNTTNKITANFGQRSFTYTPPTGYVSLCTQNLADPTIADGSTAFDTKLWTGTGVARSITGYSFSPDFVWGKARSATNTHWLMDTVRGAGNRLVSADTRAEDTPSGVLTSFNSDGFSIGTNTESNNSNGTTYVGWAWDAGANSSKTYTVKVVSDSGNKYRFDDFGTSAVTLDLEEGSTYVFDQSDSSNSGHPLRFSTTSDGTHNSGSEYTTGVTTTGTPGSAGAKTTIVVGSGVATLYYYCSAHSGMGGQANTNSTAGASNFDGSIQSTVKASQANGFSIATYTGVGTNNSTIGHGLNAAPSFVIIKNRSNAHDWAILHTSAGTTGTTLDGSAEYNMLYFSTAAASNFTNDNIWNPTSTTVKVNGTGTGNWVNANGDNYLALSWAPVEGFSAFGSYTGNGSATSPPFVFTGFRPRWVLFKNASGSFAWHLYDTARDTFNLCDARLRPDNSAAEDADNEIDILSNGFMPRTSGNGSNQSGSTFIYAAFAEHPFKTARAR